MYQTDCKPCFHNCCCCRWTLSSKRPPTWTTWPSCMRVGLPGCECQAASCLWSSEGLEIHLSPAGLGCRNSSTRPHWGEEVGSGCLVHRTRLLVTQKGEVTSQHRCNHTPPTIGDRANTALSGPHLPFRGLTRQSSAEWGRGEGGQRPHHPQLENTFPPHLPSSQSSYTHKHHFILLSQSNSI